MADGPVRIVVLDGRAVDPGDNPWDELAALGELTVHPRTPPDEILSRSAGAQILLTNKTPLSAATIGALPDLRFVSVLATGYDVVDVAAARARGIPVSNVSGYSTDSVVQHLFALLFTLTNRPMAHDAAARDGRWAASPDFSLLVAPTDELAGKLLGIVGLGRIGRRVARAGAAFGMEVAACAPRGFEPPPGVAVRRMELEQLFEAADVVSLHCPLSPANAGFANAALFARMKPGAYFLNLARGGLVNEADLAAALNGGRLAGAAVDVVSREPIDPGNPLLGARNLLITPHVAWASLAARKRLMAQSAENVRAFLAGRPMNVVNLNVVESGLANEHLGSR